MDIFRITVALPRQEVAQGLMWVYVEYEARCGRYDQSWPTVACQVLDRAVKIQMLHMELTNALMAEKKPLKELAELGKPLAEELAGIPFFEFSQYVGNDYNNRQPAWLVELISQFDHTEIRVTPVSEDIKIARLYKTFAESIGAWIQYNGIKQIDETPAVIEQQSTQKDHDLFSLFDEFYRTNPNGKIDLKKITGQVPFTHGTVKNKHSDYTKLYGKKPMAENDPKSQNE